MRTNRAKKTKIVNADKEKHKKDISFRASFDRAEYYFCHFKTRIFVCFVVLFTAAGLLALPPKYSGPTSHAATEGIWTYNLIDDGTHAEVTGCSQASGSVSIPSTLGGKTVTSMKNTFSSKSNITSVTIPSSVTNIGDNAFYSCGITSITLPAGLKSIGGYAFSSSKLTSITIPNSVTSLGGYVFDSCSQLTSVTIGSGVSTLPSFLFNACTSLTSFTIPSTVTTLWGYMFGKSGLKSITIPATVTSIGSALFSDAASLTSITVAGANPNYYSAGNCVLTKNEHEVVAGCPASVLPATALSVDANAFRRVKMGDLIIPDNIKTLKSQAFADAELTSVSIGSGLESIGDISFGSNPNLTTISVKPSNPTFKDDGNCVIDKATNELVVGIKTSVIPDYITGIRNSAFNSCGIATEIRIPDTVKFIGATAFNYCTQLTKVVMGNNVESIGTGAFQGCSNLVFDDGILIIPESVTSIGGYAFQNCKYETLIIKAKLPANSSFSSCTKLKTVEFSSGTTVIGTSMFGGCSELTNITFPDTLTEISNYAFSSCKFDSIVIPDTVTKIGTSAFSYCSLLQSVKLPGSLTFIGPNVFTGCSSLTIHTQVPESEKPADWDVNWNSAGMPVVWGKTLIFKPNGAVGSEAKLNYYADDSVMLPASTSLNISKEGYAFVGWSKSASPQSETVHDSGTEYDLLDSAVLYAIWDKEPVDTEALSTLIRQCNMLIPLEADFTALSWSPFSSALQNAESMLINIETSDDLQTDVDAMVTMLTAAKDSLVNISALTTLVAQADILLQDDYTPNSWNIFAVTLNTAKSVLSNPTATQIEADDAETDLQAAMLDLIVRPDKSALASKITEAESITTQLDYTSVSWAALQNIIAQAITVRDDINASQTETDNALAELTDSISELVQWRNLKTLITEIDALVTNSADYTGDSWSNLATQLSTAKTIAENDESTQSEIDGAISSLQLAKDGLISRKALGDLIDSVDGLTETDYTLTTWSAFVTEINEALTIYNGAATGAEISQAVINLQSAISALALRGDITELYEYITNTITPLLVDEADYTTVSWAALTAKIQEAEVIIQNFENYSQEEMDTALSVLKSAKNNLISRKALGDLIAEAEAVTASSYTAASYNALNETKNTLETSVYGKGSATAAEISQAVAELQTAIEALVLRGDTTELERYLAEVIAALIKEDYTPSSWGNLEDELILIDALINNENATQDDAGSALSTLKNLKEALIPKADKTILEMKLTQAKVYKLDDFTSVSGDSLQMALAQAESIFEDANALQTDVDNAAAQLTTAINGLIEWKNLKELIKEAQGFIQSEYTSASWSDFASAKETGENTASDESATQSQIDQAIASLETAIKLLIRLADKSLLIAKIEEIEALALQESSYTLASWNSLHEVYSACKEVRDQENATQEEVNTMLTALNEALIGLVDLTELKLVIDEIGKLTEDNYSSLSWNVMLEKYNNAIDAYENANATKTEINNVTIALRNAKDALIAKSDKTALKELISVIKEIDETRNAQEKWNAMQTVLSTAQILAEDSDTTQTEIDNAFNALQAARDDLVNRLKNTLDELMLQIQELSMSDYVTSSWDALQEKLSEAEQLYASTNATPAEIDAMIDALAAAKNSLVVAPDSEEESSNTLQMVFMLLAAAVLTCIVILSLTRKAKK